MGSHPQPLNPPIRGKLRVATAGFRQALIGGLEPGRLVVRELSLIYPLQEVDGRPLQGAKDAILLPGESNAKEHHNINTYNFGEC